MRTNEICVFSALICSMAAGTVVSAADLFVPGQFATIQSAIDAAASGDTIRVSPGLYAELINFSGKRLVIESTDGAASTSISGQGTGPVVSVISGEPEGTTLRGFTVRDGVLFGSGSGIFIAGSQLNIEDCVIAENTGTAPTVIVGAAVVAEAGHVRVSGTTFRLNFSGSFGGAFGLVSGASGSIVNSRFEGNSVDDSRGGAIHIENSTLVVTGTDFVQNFTGGGDGGAINSQGSTLTVTECLFDRNEALGGSGGGISSRLGGSVVVTDCQFLGNIARSGSGGGVSARDMPSALIDRCVFAGNSSPSGSGGAVTGRGTGSVTVSNSVITGSTAPSGSGGAVAIRDSASMAVFNCTTPDAEQNAFRNSGSGTLTVTNTIARGETLPLVLGARIVVTYSNFSGPIVGTGNVDAAPLFIDAANGDYGLAAGSPGIDAGNNGPVASLVLDLDGNVRFADDASVPDSGAGPAPIVDMGALERVGVCAADFNGDTTVDFFDYLDFVAAFSGNSPSADFNGDTTVDFFDYLDFVAAFSAGC